MFDICTLDNGVTVVLEKIPFVRSIAFGIWTRNGSRDEKSHNNGISHFIEHMFFKGTEKRSAMDIADEMDQVGGQLNAFTSKEYTCYYARTLDTHFDIALDILSDMFFNSLFDEAETQKEKKVIMEEINMYEDTPEDLVHDILQQSAWENNSLSYSVLGSMETINEFNSGMFKKYYENNYRPENTVVAVAGNFDVKTIIEKISKYFSGFNRETGIVKEKCGIQYSSGITVRTKDIEQVHICTGFPSISMGSEDSYALALLNTVFGGGMSSRLFQKIREEKALAYSIYSYNASYSDAGLFTIYAAVNPSQIKQFAELMISEINRMFTDKITEVDLNKCKEQLKSNYLLSLESSSNRMNSIGRSQLMLNRILTPDELINKIDAVNLDTIYRLTGEILDINKMSAAAVGNIDNGRFTDIIKSVV